MRRAKVGAAILVALGCEGCACSSAQPAPNALPPRREGVKLERVFPAIDFDRPVFVTAAPGHPALLFVVEQGGVVYVLDEAASAPARRVFLDLSAKVSRAGNEEGLLGLAFHPEFAESGRFFVDYSAKGEPRSVVAELRASGDPPVADPESERVLFVQPQPYRNHNGGMIAFGPDGYLYVGFGDGGSAGDPLAAGQDLGTWLGKILRIDVDTPAGDATWSAPPDNPFVGQPGRRPEIWAFGLRNPWRFSFDRATGALWAGDVGQGDLEEVDIVTRGGNYGWRVFEGSRPFSDDSLSHGVHVPPVAEYGRHEGKSITGGYVYRGSSLPLLQGVYVFGDYESGRIWGLRPAGKGTWTRELLVDSGIAIASFGEDAAGELYVGAFDGGIYRFVLDDADPEGIEPMPARLSDTGLFADVAGHVPAPGAIAYDVNAPLWSDGAAKRRFFRVPPGAAIGFSVTGAWTFPDGFEVVKTFELDAKAGARRLETRVIRKRSGHWQAVSYVWNESQTEATLAPDGARVPLPAGAPLAEWVVPSKGDCRSCHTGAAGFVLGIETAQVHRDGQLATWIGLGLFGEAAPSPGSLPALARPDDESAPLEARARAHLHANCAQCHRPGGPGNATIDLRYTTSLEQMQIVGVEPAQGDMGIAGALIVAPGDPDRSTLVARMDRRTLGAMPPLASALVDEPGVALVKAWVASLGP